MKRCHRSALAAVALLATLPLFSCGNALEGGSTPSGSMIRVVSVLPNTGTPDALTPDLYLTSCTANLETGEITYEKGLHNSYMDILLRNDSRPATPTDQSTNSFVTMTRYRVDFTGLNMSVSIPSIDGAGATVGIAPDSTGAMTVLVMDLATMEIIRSHYPAIGNGQSLTLRATITVWGEDAFKVSVSAQADVTLVVDNYNRC